MASVHKRNHRGRIVYRAVWRESGPGGKPRLRNRSFAKAAEARAFAAKNGGGGRTARRRQSCTPYLSAVDLDRAYAHLLRRGGRSGTPLTARSVGNVHHFLHAALEQARKWKLISENPARDARAPSPARSRAWALTAEEVQRLLGAAAAEPEIYAV